MLNRLARFVGLVISIAAIAFVAMSVNRTFATLRLELLSPSFVIAVAGSCIVYALILQLIGFSWYRLLLAVDRTAMELSSALIIFGRTQIYKYLPSNVLHMVGRYTLARKFGASHAALAFAQLAEIGMLVLSAAAVAAVLSFDFFAAALVQHGIDPAFLLIGVITTILVFAIGIILFVRRRLEKIGIRAIRNALIAFFCYLLFFIGNGLIVVALAASLSGTTNLPDPRILIGIGAAGWLLGFIIPGAPGGLGVREAVLIAGLTSVGVPPSSATAIALGHRLMSVLGDGLVAVIALLIPQRTNK